MAANQRGFSPMPKIKDHELEIHKMYRTPSQVKNQNPRALQPIFTNYQLNSEARKANFNRKTRQETIDFGPKPKHAIFDSIDEELFRMKKGLQNIERRMIKSAKKRIESSSRPRQLFETDKLSIMEKQSNQGTTLTYADSHFVDHMQQTPENVYQDEKKLGLVATVTPKKLKHQFANVRVKTSTGGRRVFSSSNDYKDEITQNKNPLTTAAKTSVVSSEQSMRMVSSQPIGILLNSQSNTDYQQAESAHRKNQSESNYSVTSLGQQILQHQRSRTKIFLENPIIQTNKLSGQGSSSQAANQQLRQQAFSQSVKRQTETISGAKFQQKLGQTQNKLQQSGGYKINNYPSQKIDQMIEYITTAHNNQYMKAVEQAQTKIDERLVLADNQIREVQKYVVKKSEQKQLPGYRQKVVHKHKTIEENYDRNKKPGKLDLQENELIIVSKQQEDPPFFNILIEQRHATQLARKNLDEESRLEVIYRVLKDQLRRAKNDLLQMKKDKQKEKQATLDLKKNMENALDRSKKNMDISKKVSLADSQGNYQLDDKADVDPSLKKVMNHLLTTDTRKHNRYCPCCKNYEEGNDLSPMQMGEFLEYIRQMHYKLSGDPKKLKKKLRTKDQILENDSISEVTDLSQEGILTTSMEQLSPEQQKKLNNYLRKLRQLQLQNPPKHDCLTLKRSKEWTVDNARMMVEMQLRGVQVPIVVDDADVSAHQFSTRSVQLQADDLERAEIDIQTSLIDMKNVQTDIDIYDLRVDKQTSVNGSKIGFRKTSDKMCGTGDPKVRFLAPHDWYYSELNRRLIQEFYEKNGLPLSRAILDDFRTFDNMNSGLNLTSLGNANELMQNLRGSQKNTQSLSNTFTTKNPQESLSNNTGVLCEPEVTYLTSMLKQKSEKWSAMQVLKELHAKSVLTAKTLTKELIEGKTPISLIVGQYNTIDTESVMTLLYRCEKLYQARSDVQKILLLLLKLNDAPNASKRTIEENDTIIKRLKTLVRQFKQENRIYDQTFVYKNEDVMEMTESDANSQLTPKSKRTEIEYQQDKNVKEILKIEAQYDGALGLQEGQKPEVEIINRIDFQRRSSNGSQDNVLFSSSQNKKYLEKVQEDIYQTMQAIETQKRLSQDSDTHTIQNSGILKLDVTTFKKRSGQVITRASLYEDKPLRDSHNNRSSMIKTSKSVYK